MTRSLPLSSGTIFTRPSGMHLNNGKREPILRQRSSTAGSWNDWHTRAMAARSHNLESAMMCTKTSSMRKTWCIVFTKVPCSQVPEIGQRIFKFPRSHNSEPIDMIGMLCCTITPDFTVTSRIHRKSFLHLEKPFFLAIATAKSNGARGSQLTPARA
jgi:hypothetical protein